MEKVIVQECKATCNDIRALKAINILELPWDCEESDIFAIYKIN